VSYRVEIVNALISGLSARASRGWTVSAAALLLSACTAFPQPRLELETPERLSAQAPVEPLIEAAPEVLADVQQDNGAFYEPGTDRLLAQSAAPAPAAAMIESDATGGAVTLNFENTNLLEVIKVILGDLLKRSYVIDPAVQGSVTLQSSTPIERDALLPTLSMLLRMNNAVVLDRGDMLHIVPRERAGQGQVTPQLGDMKTPLPTGFGVRVVALRFIGAQEMRDILEPLSTPGNVVRVDSRRNLLILSGSTGELEQMMETVALFDVDWMQGMSIALFRPGYVDARTLADELEEVLGSGAAGPLDGVVRFVVIDRLNGLLVITSRSEYLARVRKWVERLDLADGGVSERLFIYHVQNGKAIDLAEVLSQIFNDQGESGDFPAAEIAPGLEAAQVSSQAVSPASSSGQQGAEAGSSATPDNTGAIVNALRSGVVPTVGEGLALSSNQSIRIIADEVNNALLIMASAQEYRQVEAALRQLDIAPLQVLIEATIAEVRLEDQLSQGLEWFFKNHYGSKKGTGTLDLNDVAGIAAVVPGFSYAITDSAAVVRAVLNTLATESRAKIISSPSLMVLNNQQATIQVGDQVPITTQQQQSTTGVSNIVNNIEYRDTGVLLSVTPRVNSGGLVTMEIEQEVSNLADNADISLTPTIQTRNITSTVAVQSGETVVLGGLIRENNNSTGRGIPGLRDIPVLGWFFGASRDEITRTELVVLITPRAVRGAVEARAVTDEFREKMDSLKPNTSPHRGFGPWNYRTDELRDAFDGLGENPPNEAEPVEQSPNVPAPGPAPEPATVSEHNMRMERVLTPGRPSRPSAKEPEPVS